MITRTVKLGLIVVVLGTVAAGVLFGREAFSYMHASVNQVRQAARDSVPIEFELARARDMIDQIVPQMQANISLIAREEVEIEQLETDIAQGEGALVDQRQRLVKLRNMLDTEQTRFVVNRTVYLRDDVRDDLSRSLERMKEARVVLEGKRRLLTTRRQNLTQAIAMLEQMRHKKVMLEDRVEALAGQFRLVQAAGSDSNLAVDGGSLAKAEKLVQQIKTRLDVAERVLSHEAKFANAIPVEKQIDEGELISEVDAYLNGPSTVEAPIDASAKATAGAELPVGPASRTDG
jgi:hypothetical protein